jgi:RHS repeat-associated protein
MRWRLAAILLCLLALTACFLWWHELQKAPGEPILTLEECDPARYMPCAQQEAFASIPITDTGVYLTYSSRWAPASPRQHLWDANSVGLGGWSINVLQHYDRASRLFVSGDGSWRVTDGVALPSGEQAVPSYDGSLAYIFDSAGRQVRTADGHLGTELIKVSYDSAGRLAKIDGFMNGQPIEVSVQRDSSGRTQSLVGTDGGTTALGLDSNSRLVSVTNPAGETTRVTWNAAGFVESVTDPIGGAVRFTYDPSGRLATLTDADGIVQHFDYSTTSTAFEVRVSTAQGRYSTYRAESTSKGIRRTFIAPDGTTSTELTAAHGARALKLADGTSYSVGALSNPVWGTTAPILSPVVEKRPDGVTSRRETKYGLQAQDGTPYTLAGSVTTTINGQAWVQNFYPANHTATLLDPSGRRTTTVYDAQGRIINYSAPGSAPVSYTYGTDGRAAIVTVGTGKLAQTTHYAYNASTGEIVTTRPDGTTVKVTVDKAGQAVRATAGDGSTTLAGYDAAGRLVQLQPPGELNYTFGMSPAGRATGFAPPMLESDGSVETTAYDKDGQLAAISGPGRRAINYQYDSSRRVVSSTFDQGKATASYDAYSGLKKQTTDPSGVTTTYGYVGSTLDRLSWSGPVNGAVDARLDANGRATREGVNGSNSLDFTYDASGNLTGVGALLLTRDGATGLVTRSTLGAIETKQQFDGNGLLSRSTTTAGGKVVLDDRYTRDALGRINTVTETGRDGKTSTTEYSYDRAGRLSSTRINGSVVETDAYDPAGNRMSVVHPSGQVTAKYDLRERVLNWGSTQYSWAPDGNLARRIDATGTSSFTYDDFGALRGVTLSDGRTIKYLVDADGRRVGREVDGKLVAQYLYRPDGSIAAELDSAGRVVSRFGYDNAGHLALVERGGATYRVITDTVGSPRLILNSRTGAVAEEITYDAWGNVTRDAAPRFIPIGFAGGLRDPDTGLVRFGARDYDPTTGRWTAADPIRFAGGDANLYRYAAADPVNLTDRTGLVWCAETGRSTTCYEGNPPPTPQVVNYPEPDNNEFWNSVGTWTTILTTGGISPVGQMGQLGWLFGSKVLAPAIYGPQGGNGNGSSGNGGSNGEGGNGGDGNGFGNGTNPPNTGNPPSNGGNGSSNGGNGSSNGGNPPSNFSNPAGGGGDGNGGIPNSCSDDGDPHLTSLSGAHFDLQAAGEFLAASAANGGMVIQARQQQLGNSPVAINTAIAANVDGDRVSIYTKEPEFLMINNEPAEETDLERHLPHGGRVERHGGLVEIRWSDGTLLKVTRAWESLNFEFAPTPNVGPIAGLLGGSAANESGNITARDGTLLSVSDRDFQTKIYRQFANGWRIKQSESLFHYWPGESTAKFTDLTMPLKAVNASSLSSDTRSKAEAICRSFGAQTEPLLDDCILDVGITGMPGFAAAYAGLSLPTASRAATAPAAASSASVPAAGLGTDKYAINIGDTVSPDHPSLGAGMIRKSGEKQSYLFSGQAGQIVYVKFGSCDGDGLHLDLYDPTNFGFAGTFGCHDFGPVTLAKSGTYKFVAYPNPGGARAHYTFSVLPTTFEKYSIKIGDTVSRDHPAKGAGSIVRLGERQSYSFSGQAGQIVYVKFGSCDGVGLHVDLHDPTGFGFAASGGCHDFGPATLAKSGTYQMLAYLDTGDVSAHYAFTLLPTTFEKYSIKIGDTVSRDHPAKGAGTIARLGEKQSYSFAGQAGQIVYVKFGSCDGVGLHFDLHDPTGFGFAGSGGCHDFGPFTLGKSGSYQILTYLDTGDAGAHYTFTVLPTTFEKYSIKIGDTVSPDHPGKGAGTVVRLGERQSYSFSGRPGETVYVKFGSCDGVGLHFDLHDPTNFGFAGAFGCHDFGPFTLTKSGTYELLVYPDTGTTGAHYAFSLQPSGKRR